MDEIKHQSHAYVDSGGGDCGRCGRYFDDPVHDDALICPDCGGPGVTWEDGYVLCDACARKRARAARRREQEAP